jgi:hypothetical protein
MQSAQRHLPDDYRIRLMREEDHAQVSAICASVHPTERPYTEAELRAHHALFPDGQFIVEHAPSSAVAGAHFTLLVNMMHFHVDDSWDALTAGGSRMPGYGRVAGAIAPDDYIGRVKRAEMTDPVLTAHLHDGWDAITAIRDYLPHDEESAG